MTMNNILTYYSNHTIPKLSRLFIGDQVCEVTEPRRLFPELIFALIIGYASFF